jgi:hypothetical protein
VAGVPYDRAVTQAIAFFPFEAFRQGEQRAEGRHELVGGRAYPLAGGSERHHLARRAPPSATSTWTGSATKVDGTATAS